MEPYYESGGVRIFHGDCRDILSRLPGESVQCCVTSPPYWGLRDYGHDEQIGLEQTPEQYVEQMVSVFREVRRVMKDDGTLWLNLGDSYAGQSGAYQGKNGQMATRSVSNVRNGLMDKAGNGIKPKDLVGIPWRVAFALQADGWYLRQDIIWHKPNPMPESVTDRCTKAHEYIFLLAKSARYYYDNEAIAEPVTQSTIERLGQPNIEQQAGSDRVPGKTNGNMKAVAPRFGGSKYGDSDDPMHRTKSGNEYHVGEGRRNRRSVWSVTTKPFKGAHFATFPEDLIEPCILAGSGSGDVVLDPFGGAGTTALVAKRAGRGAILTEINEEYIRLAIGRINQGELFTEVHDAP